MVERLPHPRAMPNLPDSMTPLLNSPLTGQRPSDEVLLHAHSPTFGWTSVMTAEETRPGRLARKSRLESPGVFASFADIDEVGSRRDQLLRAGRGQFVVDVLSLHIFTLPVTVTWPASPSQS